MDWWEQDLQDLVDKDYNHPSVILYSTGNEVAETAQPKGIAFTGQMTDYLHSLDDSRPVSCGVNIFFNFLSSMGFGVYSDEKAKKEARKAEQQGKNARKKAVGSEFFNNLAGLLGDEFMKRGATLPPCDWKTRDAYAKMDVAGYNYGIYRYPHDLKKYPHRLILGSETFCKDAARFYDLALREPRVIGDFVWRAWTTWARWASAPGNTPTTPPNSPTGRAGCRRAAAVWTSSAPPGARCSTPGWPSGWKKAPVWPSGR